MKGKQFIGIIGIVLATQCTVFAQSHLKIGYTNVDYVLSQMPEAKQIESELKWIDKALSVVQTFAYVPLIAVILNNSYEAFLRHENTYGFCWGVLAFGVLVRFTRLVWELHRD